MKDQEVLDQARTYQMKDQEVPDQARTDQMKDQEVLARLPHDKILGERLSRIVKLREAEKKTFKAIGNVFGFSIDRARQLYQKAKWLQEWHKNGEKGDPHFGLSTRAANICNNHNLMNRAQIETAIKDGRLHPKNKHRPRCYGWKTHREIHKWIGLPEPQRARPRLTVCPHCGGKLD